MKGLYNKAKVYLFVLGMRHEHIFKSKQFGSLVCLVGVNNVEEEESLLVSFVYLVSRIDGEFSLL